MKISLNWLRDFVDISEKTDFKELARLLTIHTAEIEDVEDLGRNYYMIVVGQIDEIHPHPNADKLKITKTNVGGKILQIVCGANNIHVGMYVPVALVGAKIRWHGEENLKTLETVKIRGIESSGMICAGDEMGLEEKSAGIYDLSYLKPKIGTIVSEIFAKNDIIFTIDNKSLTHRPDLWGHYGIAREIAAITGKKLKPYQSRVAYPLKGERLDIEVKEKKLCPRYIGVAVENIKIEHSPAWLANRLKNIGYRSINNIVDATNYVMAELGQPLHAFDADKIEKGIIVHTAKKGEIIQTLDGIERKMTEEMLIISDHHKPIGIAGIMGAANSEISETTTKIIIESANFHPASIRKTALKLGLRTEAVQRFEKSLDARVAEQAIDRVCEIILKICPSARIAGPKVDVKNFDDKKTVVHINLKKIFSKIGAEIPSAKAVSILKGLEFKPTILPGNKLKIEIPSFRATKDISIEDDIVEEIARMYGYENIEARLPEMPIKLPLENRERDLKHRARQIMALGLGFNEVYNYSFYSLKDIKKCLLPEELHIKVQNYLSEDQTHLRISLLPNLLKNTLANLKNFDHFKLFEIGRTYEDLQEYFPIEEKKICGLICNGNINKSEPFYDAKGALETFLEIMGIAGLEARKGESFCPYAHPNRYAAYFNRQNDEEVARLFELHPLVAKNFELNKYKIAVFEINFSKLSKLKIKEVKYKPITKFPGISFDISFIIDKNKPIAELQKMIQNCDRNTIQKVRLFDIYEGHNIPKDKKSLAFQIELRAEDRTLTDEEGKRIQQAVVTAITKAGGQVRTR